MTDLLPCPFCGGEASHNGGGGSVFGRFWWTVGCKTCDVWLSDKEVWSQTDHGMLDTAYPPKHCFAAWNTRAIPAAEADNARLRVERDHQRANKDQAYEERNRLVALLASLFPSGTKRTVIPGWDAEWHGCVYIDFPWGQASWHYHDSQAHLFAHLPPYPGEWNGHTTEAKYAEIQRAALNTGKEPSHE